MAATFSSALAHTSSCVGKTRSSLERQAAGGVEVSVRWERRVSVDTDRLWQVHLLSRLSLSWLMRSLTGPVHLSLKEVLWWWFLLLFFWVKPSSKCWCVCSVPFSLEGSIVVTFAENWSQSKYVVSDPRNVSPECVYNNPRDLIVAWVCIRSEGLVTWVCMLQV